MLTTLISDFSRCLTAEYYKLKGTPLPWISTLGGAFVAVLVFLLFHFNVEELVQSTAEPWARYLSLSVGIACMLLIVPHVILVSSAIVFPEHHGGLWKLLYTLPLPRGLFYFSKLVVMLLLLALAYGVFCAAVLGGGYLLGVLHPGYGFLDRPAPLGQLLWVVGHAYLSLLGVAGLHYWLALRWKNFIAPVGIGMAGFILGFLMVKKSQLSLFFPYCYPMIRALLCTETTVEAAGLRTYAGLVEFEWYSLGYFILFSWLGFVEISRRNVQ